MFLCAKCPSPQKLHIECKTANTCFVGWGPSRGACHDDSAKMKETVGFSCDDPRRDPSTGSHCRRRYTGTASQDQDVYQAKPRLGTQLTLSQPDIPSGITVYRSRVGVIHAHNKATANPRLRSSISSIRDAYTNKHALYIIISARGNLRSKSGFYFSPVYADGSFMLSAVYHNASLL